jgi:hypothetical protein
MTTTLIVGFAVGSTQSIPLFQPGFRATGLYLTQAEHFVNDHESNIRVVRLEPLFC